MVGHLHEEMKQIHQTLLDIEENRLDPSERSTSSVLGRYIQGAKNNFRNFTSVLPSESKSVPLLANIHNPNSEDVGDVNGEEIKDMAEIVEGKMEEEGPGDEIKEQKDEDQSGDGSKAEEDGACNESMEEESNDQTVVEDETTLMEEGRAQEGQEMSLIGSSGSRDTGFGSQELEFSASSPE